MNESKSKCIVGIAGASGSGKSYLANHIVDFASRLGIRENLTVLHEDSYYHDQNRLSFQQRQSTNYDHPNAFDHNLLAEHLEKFLAGEKFNAPVYDYTNHNRSVASNSIEPTKVLIVEGILVLHEPKLRELFNLKLFVDVPLDICLARRIRRDSIERGREIVSILDQFENSVRPMHFQFVEPTRVFADLVVPNVLDNHVAAELVANQIRSHIES